ncbi:MAG: hypothetical protein AAGA92_06170 [Planctomycetota bacterium]
MLRCLVASWDVRRGELLCEAAADESWQTVLCEDGPAVLKSLFQLDLPLAVFDLPSGGEGAQWLREATLRAVEFPRCLVVACVERGDPRQEQWARESGVWAYLPEPELESGVRVVFRDAREAFARQALSQDAVAARW